MAAKREATVRWEGDLMKGKGRVTTVSSDVLKQVEVSWPARTEEPGGKTSPEELLAAAHASCFSMALSGALAKAGTPPESLEVRARVTFDKRGAGWAITTSELEVKGVVPGAEAAAFQEAAEGAKDGCPVSQALSGNVQMSVSASLMAPAVGA
jgi:lipoyl-dependent peroxiredoxin